MILGYPWFTVTQPRIDWKKGWIDHSQLPIVLRAPNAQRATFVPRIRNVPQPTQKERYFLCRVTVHPEQPENADLTKVPEEFHRHAKVFSEQKYQRLPRRTVRDHAIELLPNCYVYRLCLPLQTYLLADKWLIVRKCLRTSLGTPLCMLLTLPNAFRKMYGTQNTSD